MMISDGVGAGGVGEEMGKQGGGIRGSMGKLIVILVSIMMISDGAPLDGVGAGGVEEEMGKYIRGSMGKPLACPSSF